MRRVVGHFEDLHFTESNLGAPVFEGRTMKIYATGLIPIKGYPIDTEVSRLLSGNMIFKHVTKSIRSVTEYIGDPKRPQGFQEERIVIDIDERPDLQRGTTFIFEGILQNPLAWVEWEVVATEFEFHID